MKKLLILICTIFLISACGENITVIDELTEDEKLLEFVKRGYEENDFPSGIFDKLIFKIDEVKDNDIRKSLVQLSNDIVLKIIKNQSSVSRTDYERALFTTEYVVDFNDIKFNEHLTKEIKEELLLSIGIDPIDNTNTFIENQSLKLVELNEYNGYTKGSEIRNILESDNDKNDYIIDSYSNLFVIDNSVVIDFGEMYGRSNSIYRIFKIENDKGEVLNPFVALEKDAIRRSTIEEKRSDARLEEYQKRQKEETTIRLGMTDDEVIRRWGDPEKINRSVGSWGVHEQWVFSSGNYLYFENGILTSWQD